MKKVIKALLISGITSIMFCTTAFATEVEVVTDNTITQETIQTESQNQTEVIENTYKKGSVTVDILNVRSGPSTSNEKVGKLFFGSTIEIVSEADGWYEINFDSKKAYISSEYVRIIDGSLTNSENMGINIVEYAKTFLGTPYAYGGNTPRGFDCSGFVQYVISNFGVNMPRTSNDQYSIGVRVNKSDLMPGDLVYFKYNPNSYKLNHVGIYVGNGNFIHSPVPGQAVKISPLNTGYFSYYYYGATRVFH